MRGQWKNSIWDHRSSEKRTLRDLLGTCPLPELAIQPIRGAGAGKGAGPDASVTISLSPIVTSHR